MRYVGIDYGIKKTGLALSDEAGHMGFPHAIVPTKNLGAALRALVAEKNVQAFVIGESRDFNGAENPVAADAKLFARELESEFHLPIHWEPESMTSAVARRAPGKMPKSRAPQIHKQVDDSAAALILTSYLSKQHA